ncbi:lipid phosphate phosphatase 1 [Amanita muscaria]
MPGFVKAALKRAFGDDALDWFDKLYFVDWAVVVFIWILSWFVSISPVFVREFSAEDPLINHLHKKNTVSSGMNHWSALLIPVAIFTIGGVLRSSLPVIHHGIISVCASRGLAQLVTEFLKHTVGRLRPDFLSRCKWDKVLKACTGPIAGIVQGRESFPSGHSSTAFSGMAVLSLWLAGQTAAWCFKAPSSSSPIRSRLASLFLTLLPLFWAAFVAVSRVEDNRHHPEDVVVGSTIGIISSMICYHLFWPSPFSAGNFKEGISGQPRLLYTPENWVGGQRPVFHLARLEEDNVENV